MFYILLDIDLGVELLQYVVTLCLTIYRTTCFPKWLYNFTFPLAMHEGSNFSTSSPMLAITSLFDYSHLVGVKQYLTVILICISFMPNDEHFFMCLVAYVYLLWRYVYSDSWLIFWLFVFFIVEL